VSARADAAVVGALRRASVYRLLGAALAYPMAARVGALARWAELATGAWADPALAGALARFGAAARGSDPETLAAEHVRLFDREVRCPPYEGAWGAVAVTGKAALLADVAGFYAAFGLGPAAGQPETEDHLGAELEFMGALALKEAWALARGQGEGLDVTRAAARAFLAEHLGCWAGSFARHLAATSPAAFYRRLAALLEAWLARELAGLEVTPLRRADGPAGGERAPMACPMAPAG